MKKILMIVVVMMVAFVIICTGNVFGWWYQPLERL